jgi:uncharacterized RDD family membrane protein YckC
VTQAGTRFELASWWRRVAALLLDGLIIGIPVFAVSVVLGWILYSSASALVEVNHPPTAGHAARFVLLLAISAINIAYAVWFLGHRSQTIGMSIVGVKALDRSGEALSHSQAWRRAFTVFLLVNIWLLPGVFLSQSQRTPHGNVGLGGLFGLLYIGGFLTAYLWPLGNPLNQTLQDKVVGSIVVIGKYRPPVEDG